MLENSIAEAGDLIGSAARNLLLMPELPVAVTRMKSRGQPNDAWGSQIIRRAQSPAFQGASNPARKCGSELSKTVVTAGRRIGRLIPITRVH